MPVTLPPGRLRLVTRPILTGSAALVKTMGRWASVERQDDPFVYVRRVMVNTHITWWRRWTARVTVGSVPEHSAPEQSQLSVDQDAVRQALRAGHSYD